MPLWLTVGGFLVADGWWLVGGGGATIRQCKVVRKCNETK